MHWRAVAVALAMLTAGCGTFVGPSSPPDSVTPAPVPTVESETPTEAEVAPGVGVRGSLDAARLADAHRRAVANRSYTWRERVSVTAADGSRRLFVRSQLRVESDTRFRYRTSTADGFWGHTEFANGTVRHQRFYANGGLRFEQRPLTNVSHLYGTLVHDAIQQYLVADRVDVSATSTDSGRVYVLTTDSAPVAESERARNVSIRATVTPSGLVRSLEARYDEGTGEQRQRVRYQMTYDSFGNVTVERPDWVRRANQ